MWIFPYIFSFSDLIIFFNGMYFTRSLNICKQLIYVHNESLWPKNTKELLLKSCSVRNNFITTDEENSLLEEIEPHMKCLRYEKSHWDDVRLPFILMFIMSGEVGDTTIGGELLLQTWQVKIQVAASEKTRNWVE